MNRDFCDIFIPLFISDLNEVRLPYVFVLICIFLKMQIEEGFLKGLLFFKKRCYVNKETGKRKEVQKREIKMKGVCERQYKRVKKRKAKKL